MLSNRVGSTALIACTSFDRIYLEEFMLDNLENFLYVIAAGVLLFAGIFIMRNVIKVAWKVVRALLIILAILMIAGYFLGLVDIGLPLGNLF